MAKKTTNKKTTKKPTAKSQPAASKKKIVRKKRNAADTGARLVHHFRREALGAARFKQQQGSVPPSLQGLGLMAMSAAQLASK